MSDVEIDFGGDFDDLKDQLDDIGRDIRGTFGAASVAAAATFTTAALEGFELLAEGIHGALELMREWIQFAAEGEQVNLRLALAVRGAGDEFAYTVEQLQEMANGLQDVSTQSSAAVKSAEQILIRFNLVGDQFERTLKLSADLSAAIGTELTSAASMLGRALNDPEQGMNFLRRSGVALDDQEKALIKTLSDSGEKLRAQEVLLQALERRLTGSAEVMRGSYLGGWQALGQIWDDIREEFGAGLLALLDDLGRALLGIDGKVTGLQSSTADMLADLRPKIKDFVTELKEDLIAIAITVEVMTERSWEAIQSLIDKAIILQAKIRPEWQRTSANAGSLAGAAQREARRMDGGDTEDFQTEVARRILSAISGGNNGEGGLAPVASGSLPINWNARVPFAGMMPFGGIDTRALGQLADTGGVAQFFSSLGKGSSNLFGGLAGLGSSALGAAGGIAGNLANDRGGGFRAQFEDANSLFKRIQSSAASLDDDPVKKTAKHTETTAENTKKLVDINMSLETNIKSVATALGKGVVAILE